jgi:hypothetical protein
MYEKSDLKRMEPAAGRERGFFFPIPRRTENQPLLNPLGDTPVSSRLREES